MILESLNSELLNLLNCEGKILSVYRIKNTDDLFAMVRLKGENASVFARTNKSILKYYLQGRFSLRTLFELQSDLHFLITQKGRTVSKFLEINSESHLNEIESLCCGTDLYPLLPPGMKPNLSVIQILQLIPEAAMDFEAIAPGAYNIKPSGFTIFSEASDYLQIVTIENEILNIDEYDFIRYSFDQNEEIFIRITPASLKLFITGQFTLADVAEINGAYIFKKDHSTFTKYSSDVHSIITNNLPFYKSSYFQLPTEIQIDSPLKQWKFYQDYLTINGRGIIQTEDLQELEVDLTIKNY
ncbi:MAG: hypothetical protein K9H49_10955 [Bacteroidales bacterium]|nr:hypothetical protein [Bacteroidales bacterium]